MLLGALPFLAVPPMAAGEPIDAIVAVVNDDIVMASELKRFMQRIRAELSQRKAELPPPEIFQKQALERLIMMKVQLQSAQQMGMRVDDDTLNRAISNIAAQNNMTLEQFRGALQHDGYSFDQFREDIRNEIAITRLRQRQVDTQIHVTDREIDNYLSTQAQQGQSGAEYHLAHILIGTPEGATPDQTEAAQEEANAVLQRLRAGEDFKKVAMEVSDSQQALEGGDMGWRKAAEVPSLFADNLRAMKKGGVSELIRNPSGFHIIKLMDVRDDAIRSITQTLARHILIKPDELTPAGEIPTQLNRLKARIEAGEDFADLARSHSDDKGSAAKGGDLGWSNPGALVPKFEEVMNNLSIGAISPPFETEFGWHIVQVLQRREHDGTEDVMRAKAREAVRKRKQDEELQAWMHRLRDEAYVEYRIR
jgi:peptidyl-prolyl cis-trans isomerase SurA